ncbi:MAG: ankyrin repeat domain-containing protein [Bacteroidia bacterium]|nr:ankyrin repeat domain-containing protein [Bacteroidia bacterium]
MKFLKGAFLFLFLSVFPVCAQINIPKEFAAKMKKYDVMVVDSILRELTPFKSQATKFTSKFLMFKNPKEKLNIAFYADTCAHHYNIIGEFKEDLVKLMGIAENKTSNVFRAGQIHVVVNSDDYALFAEDSAQTLLPAFADYGTLSIMAFYNHATKGKIYMVFNYDGELKKKSENSQNLFFSFRFLPHLPNPGTEPQLVVQSGSNDRIRTITCSKTGELMAYAGDEGVLKICKGDGSRELRSVIESEKAVTKINFSENEKLLAACAEDSTIKLWEIQTGKLVSNLKGHKGPVTDVSFFDHDTKIVSIAADSSIKLWAPKKGFSNSWICYKTIKTPKGKPAELKVNEAVKSAAVFVSGGDLILIDLKTDDTAQYKCSFPEITDMLYRYSDVLLFSNGKNIVCYDLNKRKEWNFTSPTDSAFAFLAGRKEASDSGDLKIVLMTRHGYTQICDYNDKKIYRTFYCAFRDYPNRFYNIEYNIKYDIIFCAGDNKCTKYDLLNRQLSYIIGSGWIEPVLEVDKNDEFILQAIENGDTRLFSLRSGRITWNSAEDKIPIPVKGKIKFATSSNTLIYLTKDSVLEVYNLLQKKVIYKYKAKRNIQDFYTLENDSSLIYLTNEREIFLHRANEKNDKQINKGLLTGNITLFSDSLIMLRKKNQRYLYNLYTADQRLLVSSPDSTEGYVPAVNKLHIALFAVNEKKLLIFENRTGKALKNLINPFGEKPWTLTMHPFKSELIATTKSGEVVVYDFDKNAVVKKFYPHKKSPYQPKFTNDGRFLITHGTDGFTKLWQTSDYTLTLSKYASFDKDFITFTPDFYYVSNSQYSSRRQTEFAYFTFGNSTFSLSELDVEYNRPDIIAKRLGYESEDIVGAYKKLYEKRLKRSGLDKDFIFKSEGRPIVLSAYSYPPVVNASEQKMFFRLFDRDTGLKSIHIFFNDVPFADNNGYIFKNKNDHAKDLELSFFLHKGFNKISVRIKDDKNVESYPLTIQTYYEGDKNPIKPKLHIIGIGVSEFDSSKYNLKYPAKDVRDFVKLFQNQRNQYSKIIVDTLINENATLKNIRALSESLNSNHNLDSVGVNDKVILFIASHGILDKNFDYYLATRDINFNNPSQNGLLYSEIEHLLEGISPRNKVVLIDACHSGEIDKEEVQLVKTEKVADEGAIAFRAASSSKVVGKEGELQNSINLMKEMFTDLRKTSGATVISSAGGTEYAIEGEEWNNGVFSYSLINALRKHKADANNDGKVYLSELQKYIEEDVPKITGGRQQPTSRSENISNDVLIWENDFNEELASAIKINDKELVDKLINEGADISSVDTNGATTLMWAALYSDLDLVKKLGERKADFRKKGIIYFNKEQTSYYGSLLNIAAGKNKMDLMKYLIEEKKIDPDDCGMQKETRTEIGWPALMFSVAEESEEAVDYLLSKGANVNFIAGLDKNTAGLVSFYKSKPEVCKKLIAAGMNVRHADTSGNTIVMNAVFSSNIEVMKLAIKKYKEAVNMPCDIEWYPIHAAVYGAKKEQFRLLVRNGAKLNVVSNAGFTILQLAVLAKDFELVKEVYSLCPELLNKQNKAGSTALLITDFSKNPEIAEFLIAKGTDLSIRDTTGNSALLLSASSENTAVMKMLLEKHKENINTPASGDWYPIHQAVYYAKKEQFRLLLKHGAKADVVSDVGFNILHLAVLSKDLDMVKEVLALYPQFLNTPTFSGRTPLIVAGINKNAEIAEYLCSVGADISVIDKDNNSLESLAKYYEHEGLTEVVKKYLKK